MLNGKAHIRYLLKLEAVLKSILREEVDFDLE